MAIVEQGKSKIDYLNTDGLGVGHTSKGKFELPYTIEGEIVEFERHSYRGNDNVILKKILQPSEHRQKPACQYFGSCGGCLLQHLDMDYYNKFKISILTKALEVKSLNTVIKPMISIPAGHRRRATFEVVKKDSDLFLGFHRFKSHQIVNIEECPILSRKLSALIKPLKKSLDKILLPNEKVNVSMTDAANGVDVAIYLNRCLDFYQKQEAITFARKYVQRVQTVFDGKCEVLFQKEQPYVVFGGVRVDVDEGCFLQSSEMSDQIITDLVLSHLPNTNDQFKIVDLFCGRGTFTLPLSNGFIVDGFESDMPAVKALADAASHAGRSIKVTARDLYDNPLQASELKAYEYAILNPPRLGAKKQSEALKNSGIKKIIYVSCSPESFVRDAKILCEGGYELLEVTPVDQFYYSPHLEVVGVFALMDSACNPLSNSSFSNA
jgi:23S rRNA (uracil1939-C5)-methyltransferase